MRKNFKSKIAFVCLTGLLSGAAPTWAQFTWSGCPNISSSDANFQYSTLVRRGSAPDATLWEPVSTAFDFSTPYAGGQPDMYWVEMDGQTTSEDPAVKRLNGATNTVTTLARLPAWSGGYGCLLNCRGKSSGDTEEGITGIVLDPDFKNNHWLYIHWSPDVATTYRISRFTVNGNTLDAASERIVLDIPAQRNDCCHTGGGLAFDAYGDLWISQGNNGGRGVNKSGVNGIGISETTKYNSDEWGASSTAGLRGGIVRIHPTATGTPAYTIPAGNFADYFGSRGFDKTKILPEIFTKGSRNCYRVAVDPVRRIVGYGDVGPDAPTVTGSEMHEEFNVRTVPGFMGWPYFVGANLQFSGDKTASTPTNNSKWNTGLTTLPAAEPAILPINHSATTGMAFYRYDGDLQSDVKFPPHFTRKWFVQNWGNGGHTVVTTNDAATALVGSAQSIFGNHSWNGPVDFKFGPDGAAYVVNYAGFFDGNNNTSIERITYRGTCRPADPKLELPNPIAINPQYAPASKGWFVNLGSNRPIVVANGKTGFQLYDMAGKLVWETRHLREGETFMLPSGLGRGALKYRWIEL